MALSGPDADVIVGFLALAGTIVGLPTWHVRRQAKKKLAIDTRDVLKSKDETISVLTGQVADLQRRLDAAQRRQR